METHFEKLTPSGMLTHDEPTARVAHLEALNRSAWRALEEMSDRAHAAEDLVCMQQDVIASLRARLAVQDLKSGGPAPIGTRISMGGLLSAVRRAVVRRSGPGGAV